LWDKAKLEAEEAASDETAMRSQLAGLFLDLDAP
jgi:hypothetical protein